MEQEKINIAELLQDAPKGTRLYSPICGECEFEEISEKILVTPIEVEGSDYYVEFDFEGKSSPYGECLLFPSRDVRDWGCYKVKYVRGNSAQREQLRDLMTANGAIDAKYCAFQDEDTLYYIDSITHKIGGAWTEHIASEALANYILSTGMELKLEEKQQMKFKVGDVLLEDCPENMSFFVIGVIIARGDNCTFTLAYVDKKGEVKTYRFHQDRDNLLLATPEEITKWNEKMLEPNHLHYSTGKRKIIHWFLPFDRIVVRCNDDAEDWQADIFSHYADKNTEYPYKTITGYYNECLPYNDKTAKLIGTTDDYEEEDE